MSPLTIATHTLAVIQPDDGIQDAVRDQAVSRLSERLGLGTAPSELSQTAAESAQRFAQAVQDLPISAHGVAVAALIAGLVLWLGGSKVVKPMFAVVGAISGALAGVVLVPGLGFAQVLGFPGSLVGLFGGAFAGLLLAAGAFRVVMAVAASIVLGLAGLLIGTAYVDHELGFTHTPSAEVESLTEPNPAIDSDSGTMGAGSDAGTRGFFDGLPSLATLIIPDDRHGVTDAAADDPALLLAAFQDEPGITSNLEHSFSPVTDPERDPAAPAASFGDPELEQAANDQFQAVVEACRAFIAATIDSFEERWALYPAEQRLRIAGFALGGVLVGFLIGANIPKRSAAIITAIAGSAMWITAAWWLSIAMGWNIGGAFDHSPRGWLIIWTVLSLIGTMVQLVGLKQIKPSGSKSNPKNDKNAKDDDDK